MTDEPIKLEPETILQMEYEYACKTAEQAQDDRTAIMTLYLVLVGGVSSAAQFAPQSSELVGASVIFVMVFGLLGITGFITMMKLVRLRQAWYDSAKAMNQIKQFYLEKFPGLDSAFRWKLETLPPPGQLWNITFDLVLLVAIIDSVALGIAVYFTGWRLPPCAYSIAGFIAAGFFVVQWAYYFYQLPLRRNKS